jgi:NAD(P)-dependent dehydrogenase (short-subunit alcohol dehydrogenase family)
MEEKMQVLNSTALVTGANRGIGRALVQAILSAGAKKVYAAARDISKLDGALGFDRARVLPLTLDVTRTTSVEAAAHAASDVTLLFNNAGVLDSGSILDTPFDRIERNFGTNFYGTLAMARAFAPIIEKNGGGAIVNMLTVVALASMPGLSVYNASKAAAWSMTQSLRADLNTKGIEVYGVFPGPVDTDMAAGVDMAKASSAAVAGAVLAGVIAGHEDIFPDPMSQQFYASWKHDHKAVEKQFAAI